MNCFVAYNCQMEVSDDEEDPGDAMLDMDVDADVEEDKAEAAASPEASSMPIPVKMNANDECSEDGVSFSASFFAAFVHFSHECKQKLTWTLPTGILRFTARHGTISRSFLCGQTARWWLGPRWMRQRQSFPSSVSWPLSTPRNTRFLRMRRRMTPLRPLPTMSELSG